MKFSDRLKELRKELNLTQEEVSNQLRISRQAYANWETDRSQPDINMIIELSKFFNVSVDYLICITDIRENLFADERLCRYINKCIALYREFIK